MSAGKQSGPNLYEWAKERFEAQERADGKAETAIRESIEAERQLRIALEKSVTGKFEDAAKLNEVIRGASKDASDKAEKAQTAVNVASNEWRTTFNEYAKNTVLRPEFEKLSQDYAALRLEVGTKLSSQEGAKSGAKETKDDNKAMIAMSVSVITFVMMIVGFAMTHLSK